MLGNALCWLADKMLLSCLCPRQNPTPILHPDTVTESTGPQDQICVANPTPPIMHLERLDLKPQLTCNRITEHVSQKLTQSVSVRNCNAMFWSSTSSFSSRVWIYYLYPTPVNQTQWEFQFRCKTWDQGSLLWLGMDLITSVILGFDLSLVEALFL